MLRPSFLTLIALLTLALVATPGCDSTAPLDGAGEEELITRVELRLVGTDQSVVTLTATDPDGDGADIQVTPGTLVAGMTYTGTLRLFDDLNGVDIGEEVAEEAASHLVFYTPLTDKLAVTRLDTDPNGLPLGLQIRLVVTPGGGFVERLNVKLAHYENEADKDAAHTPDDRPGSELDLDLDFPLTIQ